MKNKEKDIVLRLYDEKRKSISVGDYIEFENMDTHEVLLAKVNCLHVKNSFAKLFSPFNHKRLGLDKEDSELIMNKFYRPEEQARYKAVGIEIEVV